MEAPLGRVRSFRKVQSLASAYITHEMGPGRVGCVRGKLNNIAQRLCTKCNIVTLLFGALRFYRTVVVCDIWYIECDERREGACPIAK